MFFFVVGYVAHMAPVDHGEPQVAKKMPERSLKVPEVPKVPDFQAPFISTTAMTKYGQPQIWSTPPNPNPILRILILIPKILILILRVLILILKDLNPNSNPNPNPNPIPIEFYSKAVSQPLLSTTAVKK